MGLMGPLGIILGSQKSVSILVIDGGLAPFSCHSHLTIPKYQLLYRNHRQERKSSIVTNP